MGGGRTLSSEPQLIPLNIHPTSARANSSDMPRLSDGLSSRLELVNRMVTDGSVVRSSHLLQSAHQHAGLFRCQPVQDLSPFATEIRTFQHTTNQHLSFYLDQTLAGSHLPLASCIASTSTAACLLTASHFDDRDGRYVIAGNVPSKKFPKVRVCHIAMTINCWC